METLNIPRTQERYGTFSSSNIWKLMTKDRSGKGMGEKGKTYIKQVNHEIRLGRPVNVEHDALPTSWGHLVESRVFDLLPLNYALVSKKRLFHPEIIHWSGAPDLISEDCESDVKCPWNLAKFCEKVEALKNGIQAYKDEFPEDYWQHLSNCLLLKENGFPVKYFEAIIYTPYKRELEEIREIAKTLQNGVANKGYRIVFLDDDALPWLHEGGKYKNLNIFRFPIPKVDSEDLTVRVRECGKLLDKTF